MFICLYRLLNSLAKYVIHDYMRQRKVLAYKRTFLYPTEEEYLLWEWNLK